MATVFGNVEKDFYTAFFIPDPIKRRAALNTWVRSATPVIQAAVNGELKAFIESTTRDRWSEDGQRRGEEKLRQIQNDYHLIMDSNLRKIDSRDVFKGAVPAPAVRKTELDLHGKTVDEAIPIVDRFLEESYNARERRVWIIHGKGTGVLRREIRQYLKKHRLVLFSVPADSRHGEEGATQVDVIDRKTHHKTLTL